MASLSNHHRISGFGRSGPYFCANYKVQHPHLVLFIDSRRPLGKLLGYQLMSSSIFSFSVCERAWWSFLRMRGVLFLIRVSEKSCFTHFQTSGPLSLYSNKILYLMLSL